MKKNTLQKIILLSLVSATSIYAGGKNLGEPVSPIVPIVEKKNINLSFYIGAGWGNIKMTDSISREEFNSDSYMLVAGLNFYKYLGIEGRYYESFGDMEYSPGKTTNKASKNFPATISSAGILLKPHYDVNAFQVYGLMGYGYTQIDAVPLSVEGRAKRTENDFQYGAGLSYKVYDDFRIFVDYFKTYNNEGIDGRAKNADIEVPTYTIGVSYEF